MAPQAFILIIAIIFYLPILSTALSVNSNVIAILEPTDGYQTFTLNTTNNITRVLINNPPINLLDASMLADFHTLLTGPASNLDGPKAIIFSSANPEYFIAHLDIHILSSDHPVPPPLNNTELSNLYVNVTRLLATVPAILIAEVSGQAIAAGNEMIVQMDMRFASPGARLGAAEVGVGLTHAAGGLQHLTRLIGPGRAAEYLLGIIDADLDTLADIGWVNSAFESAAEMQAHVDALASRIALWPRGGLVATKQGIREGFRPKAQALEDDLLRFAVLNAGSEAQYGLDRWLELSNGQADGSFELGKDADLVELWE